MTHKLSKLKIENYKSIKNEEFELTHYTPLVGYNNAGKTNILEAIKWVLKKTKLKNSDFNNPEMSIRMTATIKGVDSELMNNLSPQHRNNLNPFRNNDEIVIRRTQPNPTQLQRLHKSH